MFTKKEVSLCKQVAKRHRKEIEYGDWYYYKKGRTYWTWDKAHVRTDNLDNHFPLWTISDCLEFLRERGWALCNHYDDLKDKNVVILFGRGESELLEGKGKTDNEACLKAVLAVLEEVK